MLYAVTWTVTLTVTVAATSFSSEMAFVSAIASSYSLSRTGCKGEGLIRIPIDVPGEIICLPAQLFTMSKMDFFAPPIFAAIVVSGSAFVVRTMGLWEDDS
ncbi:hypothetical protein IFM89_008688 [Coptis chinensis]|uniref:Uncharacterized protein n=1 Tax=Coptis chinensis TaxID=261450 RepID=A0A835GVG4_9MAGN|nr:hypothetical protein IFM89_008688 [Coptis chinensis]